MVRDASLRDAPHHGDLFTVATFFDAWATVAVFAALSAVSGARRGWRIAYEAVGRESRAAASRQGESSLEIEGHAGEQIGSQVASGIEVTHPREAVAALEGAEHCLNGAA